MKDEFMDNIEEIEIKEEADEKKESYLPTEPDIESETIIMDKFDRKLVDELHSENADNLEKRIYVYTKDQVGFRKKMGLFSDFGPSVVYAANKYNNLNLPFREQYMEEFGYSKLCHLYCTLDKSVMFNFLNKHIALSKLYNLRSVATILSHSELVIDPEELNSENVLEVFSQVKKNATKLIHYVKEKPKNYIKKTQVENNYAYVDILKEKFGKNLSSILLYGSSAKGTGNDFDNLVVLKELPNDLYQQIEGMKLQEQEKDVGLIFMPENVLQKFLYINVSNLLFRDYAKVLYGEINFPIDDDRYIIFKEMYHAGFGSAKLISALNLVYKEPEVLLDKEGLFEYFMKLNRFTFHGLSQADGYRIIDKNEINKALKEKYNYEAPQFRPDAEYIKNSFLEANECSSFLAKEMYRPDLAKEKKEVMLKITNKIDNKVFVSKHENKKVFLFKRREDLKENDYVPAKIVQKYESGYDTRLMYLNRNKISLPDEFYIAKRL